MKLYTLSLFWMLVFGMGLIFAQDENLELDVSELTLDWTGGAGRTYFILESEDLTDFTYLPAIFSGDGSGLSYDLEPDTESRFLG